MAVNTVERIDDRIPVRRVLISASDKRGLDRLVPELIRINPALTIYSTGGTFRAIEELLETRGLDPKRSLIRISDYTGQPEMQGGLVKSLDFKIYLGLLSESYNQAHEEDLRRTGAVRFDMVVVNLYPFRETVASSSASPEMARANIDIGGPCMIRAAAKNFLRVAAVIDPADYEPLIRELDLGAGTLNLSRRYELARKAFAYTAEYDRIIADYLARTDYREIEACYKIAVQTPDEG